MAHGLVNTDGALCANELNHVHERIGERISFGCTMSRLRSEVQELSQACNDKLLVFRWYIRRVACS